MRKFLLTLTAGIITFGAVSTAARADWDDHHPAFVYRAPVQVHVAPAYRPVAYAAPIYAPPIYAPHVYAPPVYVQPAYYPAWHTDAWLRWHHWHEWAEHHHGYW